MLSESQINSIIQKNLEYETPSNSLCATFCFEPKKQEEVKVEIIANQDNLICGTRLIEAMFSHYYKNCSFNVLTQEGEYAKAGQKILSLEGPLTDLLETKETLIYYLSRMSAIADLSQKYYFALKKKNTDTAILIEGRFWTPGMVLLEKFASSLGGVKNHTRFFQKSITIEPHHLGTGETITSLVNKLEERLSPTTKIQVHPENLIQVKEASNLGVDLIVLKNFTKATLRMALRIIQDKSLVEITGDITENELKEYSHLPISFISTDLIIKKSGFSSFSFKVKNKND